MRACWIWRAVLLVEKRKEFLLVALQTFLLEEGFYKRKGVLSRDRGVEGHFGARVLEHGGKHVGRVRPEEVVVLSQDIVGFDSREIVWPAPVAEGAAKVEENQDGFLHFLLQFLDNLKKSTSGREQVAKLV